ncbi:amidohydrolase family protein [Mycobacterium xenopi 4042]|uniref:Amidohydrolase family protein n=1 Tax=Mycobacterium xenopi 4042 TaxID=1299334 RepID=X7YRP1_MYCXE|nr:amidohydrolase family protein [Mycobacterium xenopi 4042]
MAAAAEESIVARDALLARDAGARVHICHASTAGTVEILNWAKAQGISITAEVTPHHLMLDDSRLATYDGVYRVNPPLRESADAAALRQALADGVIDCVATDHAPHAEHEKCVEFAAARPGMLGLQTALSVVVATMVEPGLLGWRDVARVMSENRHALPGCPITAARWRWASRPTSPSSTPTPPGPSPAPHWPAGRPTPPTNR